jgi:Flp pilus assembly protein TadB
MTNRGKVAVGGVAVGLLLWVLTGSFLMAMAVVIGVPAIAYLTLDPAQRRRVRRVGRKEIGR